ncbi:chemotaxis protein CheW [Chromobacterium piscinae]|uniref:Chemotaxis protein CheW n=1 Tax=Chromobacterium piscinae TaxID=686831 RepID=A0ABV0H282_9NEIS|nr:chemotaxis protein CheW [Chromobacterium piscinae]MBX9298188.1 chemotaxis protein CheW [Chromobacterium vaccinii]MBX9348610.1 chemotaxis protein CheW [Chromobacterium vaccinii]MBX9357809.1 chemotaxis protein CheW [Chromobacterium vaccinii]MCD4502939.1 chemotaxis protein CheW [Chromobacterium piscinae]MCD5329747.1 chemotaxis protein CheW [Chromobacterium piscinae]
MTFDSKSLLSVLLCRSGRRLYALPLTHVRETMRALPIDPVPSMSDFLLGLALIRGVPVPVLDCARLLGSALSTRVSRFVTLTLGERQLALAVDGVIGVRQLSAAALADIAPLLDGCDDGLVQSIATLDAELLLVLRAGRMVPEEMWEALAVGDGAI